MLPHWIQLYRPPVHRKNNIAALWGTWGKLSLCCWAFAWPNNCANGDETDITFIWTQKLQSLYYVCEANFDKTVCFKVAPVVWKNSTNTWFWRMQRIFLSLLDIFDLLNPNWNDASTYMLSVLRFGWKNTFFGQKTCFKYVSKLLNFFLFRSALIITF